MRKIFFFDVEGDIGHNYFYNYNVISGCSEAGFECIYLTNIKDDKKLKTLKEKRVTVRNIQDFNLSSAENKHTNEVLNIIGIRHFFKEKILFNFPKLKVLYTDLKFMITKLYKREGIKILHNFLTEVSESRDKGHFLTLDFILFDLFWACIYCNLKKKVQRGNISATLHWTPNSSIKWSILRYLLKSNSILKIIVHGEFMKQELINKLGEKVKDRIFTITYPCEEIDVRPKDECLKALNLNINKSFPIILNFGATRYDKGIDILIEAIGKINKNYTLIIAGQEGEFTKDYLMKKINDYQISNKVLINLNYIDEEQIKYYFSLSDIVILPYRSIFKGQSGPLTIGANYKNIIISPDKNQIGYTVLKNNIGFVFKCEDVSSLSETIEYVIDNCTTIKAEINKNLEEYRVETSLAKFKELYKQFLTIS